MTTLLPPHISPHTAPLSMMQSLRAAKRNVLELIPAIAYRQPIVSGNLGARWHMVQDPAALKRVFLDNLDNYPKSEVMLRMLRPVVGTSLFTSEGAQWRWQRRAVAPVFAQRNIAALAPLMSATAERSCQRLAESGETTEIVSEMLSATFDVICQVALSGREHFDAEEYGAAILTYFETAGKASLLDFLRVPHWIPRPGELLGMGAVSTMHKMVTRAIEARRKTDPGAVRDLLDYMIAARDQETGKTMTSRDLLHNMQFFIVAGHETTALALSWALLLLALDPDRQTRAREEAQAAIGKGPAREEQLASLPYIEAILDESMRLYPPVGMLAREVRGSDELCGREIRVGDVVFLPFYALHRHDLLWDEPHAFRPERFLPENNEGRDRYAYMPFGAGPRVCIGANFAVMQARIILASVLARFRFEPAGDRLPTPTMAMTVRPDTGIKLKVTAL